MADEFSGYSFQNGKREDFYFHGRKAALVTPEHPDPKGRWAIYTEYFGAFPNTAEALLKEGFCIARLDNVNRWGLECDAVERAAFVAYLEKELGLNARCVPIGMSCGGLHAVKFAGRYPQRVSCMYLDAAVLNLLSCPLGYGAGTRDETAVRELEESLCMHERQFLAYRDHPMDYIPKLVEARIPAVVLFGNADPLVPFSENGALIAEAYCKADIPLLVIEKSCVGHHPHGLDDPKPIVDFILEHT